MLVESILQIIKIGRNMVRILVCAPSNTAADIIGTQLIDKLDDKGMILRLNARNRQLNTVPMNVREMSTIRIITRTARLNTHD